MRRNGGEAAAGPGELAVEGSRPAPREACSRIQPDFRLRLLDDQGRPFMGVGLVWLLQHIRQRGSIAGAAQEMGMAYPKAIRILKELEAVLGQPLLVRRKGGRQQGGASFTPFGELFLDRYVAWQTSACRFAEQEFHRALGALLGPGPGAATRR